MAKAHGANVTKIKFENGQAIEPERVAARIEKSTAHQSGLGHSQRDLHRHHASPPSRSPMRFAPIPTLVLIVDGVSSMLTADAQTDSWGIDVMVSASQKAWACPPGLAMLSIQRPRVESPRQCARRRAFTSIGRKRKSGSKRGRHPSRRRCRSITRWMSRCKKILEEGLPNVFARHAHIAALTRDQAKALGFSLFGDERYASNAVTALARPTV